MEMRLSPLLHIEKGITAIIGGGGKTTLMHTLAKELSEDGTVIICTSTRIKPSEYFTNLIADDNSPIIDTDIIKEKLAQYKVICLGTKAENGKLSQPNISFEELIKICDYVIVEADGSKGLPIKAHASHEPVIPDEANQTILVIGADGLNKTISEVCHRPELFASKTDTDVSTIITPKLESELIISEQFVDRIYINKVEDESTLLLAKELASYIDKPVVAGSLHKGENKCL